MNFTKRNFSIQLILTAILCLPTITSAELCPIDAGSPALLTVEAKAGIALDTTAHDAVVLEQSPSHLVIAVRRASTLWFETSGACDLRTTLTAVEVRERAMFTARGSALVASFHALELATKEEDHEIDPDPDNKSARDQAEPLLTLIDFGGRIPSKEEDHEIDPDPDFENAGSGCGAPTKEEDHEIDPDPDFESCGTPTKEEDHGPAAGRPFGATYPDPDNKAGGCNWTQSWNAAAALVGQLGPGWYFVVRDGEVAQEILIESRSLSSRR